MTEVFNWLPVAPAGLVEVGSGSDLPLHRVCLWGPEWVHGLSNTVGASPGVGDAVDRRELLW